jgi:hypothetical protein
MDRGPILCLMNAGSKCRAQPPACSSKAHNSPMSQSPRPKITAHSRNAGIRASDLRSESLKERSTVPKYSNIAPCSHNVANAISSPLTTVRKKNQPLSSGICSQ